MLNLKDHKEISLILCIFIVANLLFTSFYKETWWDSAVYIGMGKFIYSLGNSGLWEESRPVLLPIILGLGWKIGFDELIFARTISFLFSALTLMMIYILGRKIFSKRASLIAVFFASFSFTFFFFSLASLTEIPSLFFAMLSLYFLIDKKYFLSGLCAGLCAMTRFFNMVLLIGIYITFTFHFYKKKDFYLNASKIILGFSIIAVPYLLLNVILYSNPAYPFQLQAHLTKTTGWDNYHGPLFYIQQLFRENFFLIILIFIPFFYRKDFGFNSVLLTAAVYLTIFSLIGHKEARFMIAILPFLYLLLGNCLDKLCTKYRISLAILLVFFSIIWMSLTFAMLKTAIGNQQQKHDTEFHYFQDKANDYEKIWTTSPLYVLKYDGKLNGVLYYPKSIIMTNEILGQGAVFYNNCDIACNPDSFDKECNDWNLKLQNSLKNFKIIYSSIEKECEYKILIS